MIGIISGMGAFAGTNLLTEINYRAASRAGSGLDDADFPEVMLHQIPFRSSTHLGDVDEEWFAEDIVSSARKMEAFGADKIVFACNTHDRAAQKIVETTTSTTYLSITAALHQALRNADTPNLLFLGSDRLRKDKKLVLPGKTITHPDQISVNYLIRQSIAGYTNVDFFRELVRPYPDHLVVLGCTELYPYANIDIPQPVIDSIQTLAERILP